MQSKLEKLDLLAPDFFITSLLILFYGIGLALIKFSFPVLYLTSAGIVLFWLSYRISSYLLTKIEIKEKLAQPDYFLTILIVLLLIFLIDIFAQLYLPLSWRFAIYLPLFFLLLAPIAKLSLSPNWQIFTGIILLATYILPAAFRFGAYSIYMNRAGGVMPPFLAGIGTFLLLNGILTTFKTNRTKNLMILLIFCAIFTSGPFLAALLGYRAYAIILILSPVIFYLLTNKRRGLKQGTFAIALIILAFAYTYLATSFVRGSIYRLVPLESSQAPKEIITTLEKGGYTYEDITLAKKQAKKKIFTRPFFTYRVFEKIVRDYPTFGLSHGRLLYSLMPGINKGRETTLKILGKSFTISFMGIPYLEFGIPGALAWMILMGSLLAIAYRFAENKEYAIILTLMLIWLDTGPAVWWHWLPFVATIFSFSSVVSRKLKQPW